MLHYAIAMGQMIICSGSNNSSSSSFVVFVVAAVAVTTVNFNMHVIHNFLKRKVDVHDFRFMAV